MVRKTLVGWLAHLTSTLKLILSARKTIEWTTSPAVVLEVVQVALELLDLDLGLGGGSYYCGFICLHVAYVDSFDDGAASLELEGVSFKNLNSSEHPSVNLAAISKETALVKPDLEC